MTDFIEEFGRCKWDIERFARVFLGIGMHPGQVRMANAYLRRNATGWRAFYLWLMIAAGNRAGKTLALAIIIIHSCVYRIGLEPPDQDDPYSIKRWGTLPYNWWHFAIEQGPAEQVFTEIANIFGGVSPAQKRGCPWSEAAGEGDATVGAMKLATFAGDLEADWVKGSKERGEYAHIKFSPELGGAEVHFRSTKAKALGSLGQNMHGVSFDEAGLESNLNFLMNEVLHFRRLGTGGPFVLISTPSASTSTDFEDLYATGDPEDPFREANRFSMRMSSRENIGYGLNAEVFEEMVKGVDSDTILQNIEGHFIQAMTTWFNGVAVDAVFSKELQGEAPIPGQVYIHSLDPGLKDKCWSLVFRVVPGQRAIGVAIERQTGRQTTPGIVALGKRMHHLYEQKQRVNDRKGLAEIETGVDTTSLGGHMFRDLIELDDPIDPNLRGIPVKTVEFGGNGVGAKRKLLSDLKSAIDEARLVMPAEGEWAEVRKQLRNYKLGDRKIEQDLVMGMAIIVKLLRQAPLPVGSTPPPSSGFEFGQPGARREVPGTITPGNIRRLMAQRDRERRAAAIAAAVDANRDAE